jgi:flagellar FliJ protein
MERQALHTLIELAQKASDDAAKRLGKAIQVQQEAERQLALLKQYREDYVKRLEDNGKKGFNIALYTNFQAFIRKLDDAVEGQNKIILDAAYKVQQIQLQWQACEQKRLSYNTLNDRSIAVELKKENKLDQKRTDEYAARAFFYKHKN